MGKIQGSLRISRLIDLRKCKSVITHLAQLALRRAAQLLSHSLVELGKRQILAAVC
jgi:hypothetical protein